MYLTKVVYVEPRNDRWGIVIIKTHIFEPTWVDMMVLT